ncbi:MAG: N-6 DNA methylase [bacterium]|nr:N-6 DNA methylase [bacterium]
MDDDPLYYPVEKQVEDIKAKFFAKLKGWRDSLRRELHKSYWEKYDKDQIDLFTQKILDRMIFIEVCHDKDIIGQDVHRAILNSRDDKYHELKKWFKEMDEQFNTELFAPMAIDHFDIDDKVLVPIIEELNEIDFKNVSVHIIGEVYENYLGEMLRVTKKSGLKVQEHKEQAKRKSQGIYYTPEYIVDYIVKNTVGELVKKAKTEDDLKQIKILDPACGSGSFLIKAFDVMYEAYEKLKIERNKGQLETGKDLKIKRLILQHNLYGVDLDDRAVEITKLNLMLKALEGFNFHELKGRKLLPNLNLNIRVGNSLISGQTIEQLAEKQTAPTFPGLDDTVNINPLLKLHNAFYKEVEDEEKARLIKEIEVEERRLNRKLGDNLKGYFSNLDEVKPLNYQVAFPEVFKQGGFDAVIGNPPYGADMDSSTISFCRDKYKTGTYQINTYTLFLEKSIGLLKTGCYGSFIIPSAWVASQYDRYLRELLIAKALPQKMVITPHNTFEDATVETMVIVLVKGDKINKNIQVERLDKENIKYILPNNAITAENDFIFPVYVEPGKLKLISKIKADKDQLSMYADAIWGVKIYQKGKGKPKQTGSESTSRIFHKSEKTKSTHKPLLGGSEINRYSLNWVGEYVDYGMWLAEPRSPEWFDGERLLIREVSSAGVIQATLVNDEYVFSNSVDGIKLKTKDFSIHYLLGLINSKLISFYNLNTSANAFKTTFPKVLIKDLVNLPLPKIDFKNRNGKTLHDQLVKLVKEMLKLNKTPELRQRHSADIAVIDKEIDELVYRLYGLSEAEIKVVEG